MDGKIYKQWPTTHALVACCALAETLACISCCSLAMAAACSAGLIAVGNDDGTADMGTVPNSAAPPLLTRPSRS